MMYLAKLEQRSSGEASIEREVIEPASGRSESNMPTRYDLDEHGKIRPDPEDFDAVRETPDDPLKSSAENAAYKYQLAQARKLIRLYEFGQLPIELMREMEKLVERSRGG